MIIKSNINHFPHSQRFLGTIVSNINNNKKNILIQLSSGIIYTECKLLKFYC